MIKDISSAAALQRVVIRNSVKQVLLSRWWGLLSICVQSIVMIGILSESGHDLHADGCIADLQPHEIISQLGL